MDKIIQKTLRGLNKRTYLRHLAFGSLFLILPISAVLSPDRTLRLDQVALFVINTLLYPYSRFAYESVVDFILGKNVFFANALIMLIAKFITVLLCWGFAIFIAPIGLAFLYYLNSHDNA